MDLYIANPVCPCLRCRMNKMMLPAMLTTFGIIKLLDNVTYLPIGGGFYIGVLLIVFGAVRLAQFSASIEGHKPPGAIPSAHIPPMPPPQERIETERQEAQHG